MAENVDSTIFMGTRWKTAFLAHTPASTFRKFIQSLKTQKFFFFWAPLDYFFVVRLVSFMTSFHAFKEFEFNYIVPIWFMVQIV